MNFLINSIIKNIGLPLALKLAATIEASIKSIYGSKVVADSEAMVKVTSEERYAIVKNIPNITDPMERRLIMSALNKLI